MATRISDDTRARIAAAWPDLLDALAAGEIMAPHYAKASVTADQVRVWRLEEPQRGTEWDTAREQSADAYADMIAEVASSPMADSAAARVKIQALQWLAGKRNVQRYGDRTAHDVTVKTIDLTRIISDANARLSAARQQAIEGEVLRQALPAPELDALL